MNPSFFRVAEGFSWPKKSNNLTPIDEETLEARCQLNVHTTDKSRLQETEYLTLEVSDNISKKAPINNGDKCKLLMKYYMAHMCNNENTTIVVPAMIY